MMATLRFILAGAWFSAVTLFASGEEKGGIVWIDSDHSPASRAVKVQRGGLAHTSLITVPTSEAGEEMATFISELEALAGELKAELNSVVKLNLYMADESPELLEQVEAQMVNSWPAGKRPALTLIPSKLPRNARIGGDAVIRVDSDLGVIHRIGEKAAVMPSGRDIIYVSGRAASGELTEATSGTMAQLFDVLELLKANPSDVIQVKAFIRPMESWKMVEAEIVKSFGENPVPPVVLVEWDSSSRATEIELIAAAPNQADTQMHVSYFTPPGEKISPVYSRVARVYTDEVIYLSGITANEAPGPEQEVKNVFETLESVVKAADSNLLHLVKGTYYVSDEAVSGKFNDLRPDYYDPGRPPAASKVALYSLGFQGRGLLLDMIAVPTE